MAERTTAELIERLKSGDPMDRVFAAEELGERDDVAAIGPLVATLRALTFQLRSEFGLATAIIEALTNLGDVTVADAIVETLRKTCGDDVVPEFACACLVRLGATATVPALKELLKRAEFVDHVDQIEDAISELTAA